MRNLDAWIALGCVASHLLNVEKILSDQSFITTELFFKEKSDDSAVSIISSLDRHS